MRQPSPGRLGVGSQGRGDALQQGLQDGQRQAGAGLAERRGREGMADEVGQMRQRGVAVEDLDEEDMDDRKRVEEAPPPGMTEGSGVLHNGPAIKEFGGVLAALSAVRYHLAMKAFRDRLATRGKKPKVIPTAVARKLLVIANAIVRTGRRWEPRLAMAR